MTSIFLQINTITDNGPIFSLGPYLQTILSTAPRLVLLKLMCDYVTSHFKTLQWLSLLEEKKIHTPHHDLQGCTVWSGPCLSLQSHLCSSHWPSWYFCDMSGLFFPLAFVPAASSAWNILPPDLGMDLYSGVYQCYHSEKPLSELVTFHLSLWPLALIIFLHIWWYVYLFYGLFSLLEGKLHKGSGFDLLTADHLYFQYFITVMTTWKALKKYLMDVLQLMFNQTRVSIW